MGLAKEPLGDEVLSSLTTATSLSSVSSTVRLARVQAIGGNVRFRYNTAPTASVGGVIYAGEWRDFPYDATHLALFQFIEEDSGATAYAIYEK